jgi:malate dehydrogenase (oxaloacetate-decarboxylating)(NADP+)
VLPVIPPLKSANRIYALTALIQGNGALFFCDTHMVVDPTPDQLCEMTLLAAEAVRMFGIVPRAALLSHSNFGSSDSPSARKMRSALALIRAAAPDLEVDGEMQADTALSEALRMRTVPDSRLTGSANLLIMPSLDAANISFSLLKAAAEGLQVGPILLGVSKPIHVLTQSVTARGIVNLTALIGAQLVATP